MLYLNIYHKKYQQQMKTFKRRSFLPSELQKGEPGKPDKVIMMLKHICQYCNHDNKGEQIMRNNTFGRHLSKAEVKNTVFKCKQCSKEFNPMLSVQVGDTQDKNASEKVKVRYYDAIDLRVMLEDHLKVDSKYQSLK